MASTGVPTECPLNFFCLGIWSNFNHIIVGNIFNNGEVMGITFCYIKRVFAVLLMDFTIDAQILGQLFFFGIDLAFLRLALSSVWIFLIRSLFLLRNISLLELEELGKCYTFSTPLHFLRYFTASVLFPLYRCYL